MAVTRHRGKWIVDFTDEHGKRVQRISPVQTKRGATAFEAELREAALERAPVSSTSSVSSTRTPKAPTLAVFAPEWLATYAVVNNRPSEVVSKEMILRTHLLPFFDNLSLDAITAKDIEAYKASKLQPADGSSPLSVKTINNHLTVLRRLLMTAEEWEVIERVPPIRRLKEPSSGYDWLNASESRRFLSAIEQHYPQWTALFWTALRTGLRRGELFALHWEDLDFARAQLQVHRSVFRGRLGPTKTGRGRTVPMTAELKAKLEQHRRRRRGRTAIVFPAASGELTVHQDQVDRPLHGALKKAGLRRVTFHSLRHSFASQLVSAGRTLKEVQELLGHSSIHTTMRYAHLAPERMREAVSVLDGPAVTEPDERCDRL